MKNQKWLGLIIGVLVGIGLDVFLLLFSSVRCIGSCQSIPAMIKNDYLLLLIIFAIPTIIGLLLSLFTRK